MEKELLKASQRFRGTSATHGATSSTNWMDKLKDINDPDSLNDIYIKNLKEEIRLLETQSRILKGNLGILHKDEFCKTISTTLEINSQTSTSRFYRSGEVKKSE